MTETDNPEIDQIEAKLSTLKKGESLYYPCSIDHFKRIQGRIKDINRTHPVKYGAICVLIFRDK
jgi:hypothetical protein